MTRPRADVPADLGAIVQVIGEASFSEVSV